MKNIKELCEKILFLTTRMEHYIEKNKIEKVDELLAKRMVLIQEILKLQSDENITDEIDKIVQQIKNLDEKNFAKLKQQKDNIAQELSNLTKSTNALCGYKTKTTPRSRLVDEKDA